jgi:hypothetical protein
MIMLLFFTFIFFFPFLFLFIIVFLSLCKDFVQGFGPIHNLILFIPQKNYFVKQRVSPFQYVDLIVPHLIYRYFHKVIIHNYHIVDRIRFSLLYLDSRRIFEHFHTFSINEHFILIFQSLEKRKFRFVAFVYPIYGHN